MNGFGGISDLTTAKRGRSRSVNAENPTGEKGKGGMAPSNLGPSRKGSPCLRNLASGSVTTLADIKGAGRDQSYLDHGSRSDGKGLLCSARSGAADVLG